jgi:hypothetical protein
MIPAPPSGKPVAFYDTECYPNYWLLKIRPQGGACFTFALGAGERLAPAAVASITTLFQIFTTVSFNGNYYDVPMIAAALSGYTPDQLKWLSDQIIVEERKPWELGLPEWRPADHIDLIEVLPGAGSQKEFAGRIHYKTMRDLPYEANMYLNGEQIANVDVYCENDLGQIEALFIAAGPLIHIREESSKRYGIDLRSKSDAQMGESIIKLQCEQALGRKIYKPEIDWNLAFRYEPPDFLAFDTPALQNAFQLVKDSIFTLGGSGSVVMPPQLEGLTIPIGSSVYKIGIGGLHSTEKRLVLRSDETEVIRDADVASYYPTLILNSGKWPPALGPVFRDVYGGLKDERLDAKGREKIFKKQGIDTKNPANVEAHAAHCENEGGKVSINGPFGKLGSPFSILFAPQMLIQTTVTGQLALLMLIEWHEVYGIPVVSANTDGIVIKCPRARLEESAYLIKVWEQRTGLEMESGEYAAIYSRDVNNYFAVKSDGEVKRKGQYAIAGLVEKKNPGVEICSDAVADYLSKGTPILYTLASCRDIRKFVTIKKVTGGAVKLWGIGPMKEMKVVNMTATLQGAGWAKAGRKWERAGVITDARSAYNSCFPPQRPEYLGKVIRWYYSSDAPGSIIYNTNGNTVSLSYGAKPCMTLPDEFPVDIDYGWYLANCESILKDIGAAA